MRTNDHMTVTPAETTKVVSEWLGLEVYSKAFCKQTTLGPNTAGFMVGLLRAMGFPEEEDSPEATIKMGDGA
jgi:hypothetical protein